VAGFIDFKVMALRIGDVSSTDREHKRDEIDSGWRPRSQRDHRKLNLYQAALIGTHFMASNRIIR